MKRALLAFAVTVPLAGCIDWGGDLDAGCHANGSCVSDGGTGGGTATGGGTGGGVSTGGGNATGGGTGGGMSTGGGSSTGGGTGGGGDDAGTDGGTDAGVDGGTDAGVCLPACISDGGEPPHETPACIDGACGLVCTTGWGDCDLDAGNGCELDLTSDTNNCGGCAHKCGNANDSPSCSNGTCVLNCTPGNGNCDGLDINGCETALTTSPANCGVCGFSCGGGALCAGGLCVLASGLGVEVLGPSNNVVADNNALYWADSAFTPQDVSTVNKDGTNPHVLFTSDPNVTNHVPGIGPTIAVDQDWVYFHQNVGEPVYYRGNKAGGQAPLLLNTPNGGHGGPTGMFIDALPGGDATSLLWTEAINGPGAYQYSFADGGWAEIDQVGSNSSGGAACGNHLFFWGVASSGRIRRIDLTMSPLQPGDLTTIQGHAVDGMAYDGTYLYTIGNDGNLYQIDGFGNSNVVATNGPTNGYVATDGTSIYIASGGALYRASSSGTPTSPFVTLVSGLAEQIYGVAVDANAVYFITRTHLYKTHK